MLLRRFYQEELAQAGYLVGCQATGEALIVDPNRDIDQYIQAAQKEGLRITAVTETHIHADFVSGARELAARTAAKLYLSDAGPAEWKYSYAAEAGAILLRDGDHFMVGNVRIEAIHTPGHTPEHLSFLVTDTAGADRPMGVFTGDFIFVGDVGRPDLLERAAGVAGTMEPGAHDLYRSLQRFKELPDYLQIWPGHGAGSACGRALGAVPQSTLGYEKLFNWAFGYTDEQAFVHAVLEGQPEPPPYFAQMKRINKHGPAPRPQELLRQLSLQDLEHGRAGELLLIDARSADGYAAGHIPGTLNLPAGSTFLTWAGWLLPYDRPLTLIVEQSRLPELRDLLALIGLDQVVGYWEPAILEAWQSQGHKLARFDRRSARDLQTQAAERGMAILDVRTPAEYAAGHIPGALNIPLNQLQSRVREIPRDQPLLVYCQSGARSPIAASLLTGQGWEVVEMRAGFAGWQSAGLPCER
ncbi:MAG: Zn-dependent hydrolase [Herpetosiphonaceae bacterium]|nr:MAG: Zn-dependent hydrolase [Herpetosiphonaceae bacterium]